MPSCPMCALLQVNVEVAPHPSNSHATLVSVLELTRRTTWLFHANAYQRLPHVAQLVRVGYLCACLFVRLMRFQQV